MTRTEFFEEVCDWSDLIGMSNDNNYCLGDIFLSGDQDSFVDDDIDEYVRYHRCDWEELRDILDGLDFSGEVYERVAIFEYEDITDRFEEYKRSLADYFDNNDYWDEEVEESDEQNEEESEYEDKNHADEDASEDEIDLEEFLTPSKSVV